MKKSNLVLVLCITIFQIGITAYAQKVSNITFRQEQSTIIVSYDLETKTPCKVSLYVSTNGGTKWQGPLIKVTGDVGNKIVSGINNITWNVLEEFKELKGDNIKFQVKAIISDIDTIKIGTQEWTTKNLNVSTYRNGDIIPEVKVTHTFRNQSLKFENQTGKDVLSDFFLILSNIYRKTPYLVPGTTCVFLIFFSMVVPGTKCS
jgi:hypothetical protein